MIARDIFVLNEEFQRGNFPRLALFTGEEQVEVMQKWSKDTWDKFRKQNTVYEEDVFGAILKLIDNDEQ